MSRPSTDTIAGQTYLDLRARARRGGRPTDDLVVPYILERFLYRLSRSPHRSTLVLEGSTLLGAFDERHPTADVDLRARTISHDVQAIASLVREVLAVEVEDGVVFESERLKAHEVRDSDVCSGVQTVVPAGVARAKHLLRLNVNIGEPATPTAVEVYPSLLAEPFEVIGYPLETVLGEKIVTMVDCANGIMTERDFAEVFMLTKHHEIDAVDLSAVIKASRTIRRSDPHRLRSMLVILASARQLTWEQFIDRSGVAGKVPAEYAKTITLVAEFADPILTGAVTSGTWDPVARKWRL